MKQYPFDPSWPQERQRLAFLAETYDPGTIRALERVGVSEGWQCLEVGAGGGSIADWLSSHAGNTGHVIATDIDTRFLNLTGRPNLEVWRHNIVADPLPESRFDLVHVRLLLDVLPERAQALDRMITSLKAGGWLVVEEFDSITSIAYSSAGSIDFALFEKLQEAVRRLWEPRGFDANYGRKVFDELRARGLQQLGAEGRVFVRCGGPTEGRSWRLSLLQLREHLVQQGYVTQEEIERHLHDLDDAHLTYMSPLMMTVWGQRVAS